MEQCGPAGSGPHPICDATRCLRGTSGKLTGVDSRAAAHAQRRAPESYHETTPVTGFEGGSQPGGGVQNSRFGAFGIVPCMRCAPLHTRRAEGTMPYDRPVANGEAGAGSSPLRAMRILSKKVIGGAAGAAGGSGGVKRSPRSYHELTGFVGGFQSAGGVQSSRVGVFGIVPWHLCEETFLSRAVGTMPQVLLTTRGFGFGLGFSAAGFAAAGAAAGSAAFSLFFFVETTTPTATERPPSTYGTCSAIAGSTAIAGVDARSGTATGARWTSGEKASTEATVANIAILNYLPLIGFILEAGRETRNRHIFGGASRVERSTLDTVAR